MELTMFVPIVLYLVLVWWLAAKGDGRRACSPLVGVAVAGAFSYVYLSSGFGLLYALATVAVASLLLARWDPRLVAGIAFTGVVAMASGLPHAVINSEPGPAHWVPIIIYLVVAILPLTVAQVGIVRMLRT